MNGGRYEQSKTTADDSIPSPWDVALWLADQEVDVYALPPGSKGAKIAWQRLKSHDPERIAQWAREKPKHNVMGVPYGETFVVDADQPKVLEAALRRAGLDPRLELATYVVTTGGATPDVPKTHYYFRAPVGSVPTHGYYTFGEIRSRGGGGVILAGSLHASGQRYRVRTQREMSIASARLLAVLATCLLKSQESGPEVEHEPGPGLTEEDHVILAAIGADESRGHGKVLCPAHDDNDPSLSWNVEEGRLLLNCFAGCEFIDIRDAALVRAREEHTEQAEAPHMEQQAPEDDQRQQTETTGPAAPAQEWPAPPDPVVYHGLVGDIVSAVEQHTEADPIGILGSLLAAISTRAGLGWRLDQGGYQRPSLYVALVGTTGDGRKGTVMQVARQLFDLLDANDPRNRLVIAASTWADMILPGLGSGEGLIGFLAKPGHRHALIHATELAGLMHVAERQGSTLTANMRDAWDGVVLGRDLVRETVHVSDYHVGALVGVTPEELATLVTRVDIFSGFANRFLWLAVKRPHLLPFARSVDAQLEPYVERLREVLDFAADPGLMSWGRDTHELWEAFYLGARTRHGMLAALLKRREPYVARLAMVYALLDRSTTIGLDHLEAAIALWEYAERSAVHIFGESTGNRLADSILRELQEPGDRLARSDRHFRHVSAADIDIAVDLLFRLGYVREERETTSGRPARVIVRLR